MIDTVIVLGIFIGVFGLIWFLDTAAAKRRKMGRNTDDWKY